ncbi:MAG: hypothetical protein OXG52_05910 [bacterium]|nr:hypothetical protein [bacterium]
MSGAYCPWCGARDCGGCRRPPFEAPRYCAQCGQRFRLAVHPTGWEARCRRCQRGTGSAEVRETVRLPEGG